MFELGDARTRPVAGGGGRPAARVRPRLAPPRGRVRLAGRRRRAGAGPAGGAVDHLPDDPRLLARAPARPARLRRSWPTMASPHCVAGSATTSTAAGRRRSAPRARPPPTRRPTSTRSWCSPRPARRPPGDPGARELLDEALGVLLEHFWDDDFGMVVEQWDESFSTPRPLPRRQRQHAHRRGAALGRRRPRRPRACGTARCGSSPGWCTTSPRATSGASPSTSTRPGRRSSTTTSTSPAHPFRPVRRDDRALARVGAAGAAPARRTGRCGAATGSSTTRARLFDAAVREGWAVDGADGFVYTVDWSGQPVVRRADALGRRRGHRRGRRPARGDRGPVVRRWYAAVVAAHRHLLPRPRARLVAPRALARPTSRAASPGRESRTPTTPFQATLIPRLPLPPSRPGRLYRTRQDQSSSERSEQTRPHPIGQLLKRGSLSGSTCGPRRRLPLAESGSLDRCS